MTGEAIRVYALARALDVLPQTVLEAARRLGYPICNQLSTLDPRQRAAIEAWLRRGLPEDPPEATGVPSKLPPRKPGPGTARQP
jgi:hypothetical protein